MTKYLLLLMALLALLIVPQITLAHSNRANTNLEHSDDCAASLARATAKFERCIIDAQASYLSKNKPEKLTSKQQKCVNRFDRHIAKAVKNHPGTQCDAVSRDELFEEAIANSVRVIRIAEGDTIPGAPTNHLLGGSTSIASDPANCYSFDSALEWMKAGAKELKHPYALFMNHPQDVMANHPGVGLTATVLQGFVDNTGVSEIQLGNPGDPGYQPPGTYNKYCLGTVSEVAGALGYTNHDGGTVTSCISGGGYPVAFRLDDIQGNTWAQAGITEILGAYSDKGVPISSGVIGGSPAAGTCPGVTGCSPPGNPSICTGFSFPSNGEFANHTSDHQNFGSTCTPLTTDLSNTTEVIQSLWSASNTVVIPPQDVMSSANVADIIAADYDENSVITTQCAYVPASLAKSGVGKPGECVITPGKSGTAEFATQVALNGLASLPATGVFGDESFFASFQCNKAAPPPGDKWGDTCAPYTTQDGDGLWSLVQDNCPEADCGNSWAKVIFTDASCSNPHTSPSVYPPEVIYHECSKCSS